MTKSIEGRMSKENLKFISEEDRSLSSIFNVHIYLNAHKQLKLNFKFIKSGTQKEENI